jgi:hypothetical protein
MQPKYRLLHDDDHGRKYELVEGQVEELHHLYYADGFPPLYDAEELRKLVQVAGRSMVFEAGYKWNGPNFVVDAARALRASQVHDAAYEMIARMQISYAERRRLKKLADREFYRLLLEDGMHPWRARAWYSAVFVFGRAVTTYRG